MALVLAIEPDQKQASILKRVVRDRAHAEIIVVESKDAAIAALWAHTPDLILVTALMSPRDEEELVAHLRTLGDEADHLQTITIPLLASAGTGNEDEEGFFKKKFRRKKNTAGSVGCDPWTFAEQVAGYVRAAVETRTARQAELEYERRRAAHQEEASAAAADAQPPTSESVFAKPPEPEAAPDSSELVFTQLTPPEVTPGLASSAAVSEPGPAAAPVVEPATVIPEPVAAAPESVILSDTPEPEPVERVARGVPALDPAFFEPPPPILPEFGEAAEARAGEPAVPAAMEPAAFDPALEQPAAFEPAPFAAAAFEPVPFESIQAETAPFEPPAVEPAQPTAFAPAAAEPTPSAFEPITAEQSPPIDAPAPDPIVFEPAASIPIEPVAPSPQRMVAAPVSDLPPEPVYQTPPERVFQSIEEEEPPKKTSRWRKVLSREFGRKPKPESAPAPPPVPPEPVYKPLKRLPSLAMWARTEELVVLPEPEPVAAKPEDDISDLFESLRVPSEVLPVSYPRTPHVRRVRAA